MPNLSFIVVFLIIPFVRWIHVQLFCHTESSSNDQSANGLAECTLLHTDCHRYSSCHFVCWQRSRDTGKAWNCPMGSWIVCCLHLVIEFCTCARGASVVRHFSLPLMISFNKTETANFPQASYASVRIFLFSDYYNTMKQTRGPRGPWVAHLRKRSKVTV